MLDAPRLLVFDSGMGGLTVARAIRARIPAAQMLFLVDNGGFPYGALSEETLATRVLTAIAAGLDQIGTCDAIVVACNTASTAVLEQLRARYDIPIVGVVPAVKWAASISRSRQIGVLATKATAARPYLADLVMRFAPDCVVRIHGAPHLAELAERDYGGEPVSDDALLAEIAPLFADPSAPAIDCVALGCTHYPLLLERLEQLFPERRFLDPSEAVANRVAAVALHNDRGLAGWTGKLPAGHTIFTTPPNRNVGKLAAEGLAFHSVIKI